MTLYFLDTSALVKRYVTELGSNWVMAQCQPKAGNTIVISQAALVEAVAAFCRKTREQSIEQRISQIPHAWKAGACVCAPPQLWYPLRDASFGFTARHIMAARKLHRGF